MENKNSYNYNLNYDCTCMGKCFNIIDNIWKIKDYDLGAVRELGRRLNISSITAALMMQRGISSVAAARSFLFDGLGDLCDPFCLSGVAEAVQRIEKAIAQHEKVVIYGDYDVDGVCSVVLLQECLSVLKCRADYYVPNRFHEGYGINEPAVRDLASKGYQLLISVDCGITSIGEIETAHSLGIDSIITDHHTPGQLLPPAVAVINPKLDAQPALQNLAGTGVAFMLARALVRNKLSPVDVFNWLDLVALATIADIVPLTGDNRIMVREGLLRMENTSRPGLKALLQETGLLGKRLSAGQVGFILAPKLNSAGRLGSAAISIELLQNRDPQASLIQAQSLCRLNDERRAIEEKILNLALQQIEREIDLEHEPILVLGGEGWHQGVLGIVASRLVDRFLRPVIVICWDGDVGRGSCRSIEGVDIYQALNSCQEYLLQFGGHRMAAGLSLNRCRLDQFKAALKHWATRNFTARRGRTINIDMEIDFSAINEQLYTELDSLQPFGEGNPEPSFVLRNCEILAPTRVGKNSEHLKFKLGNPALACIAFNQADKPTPAGCRCCQDLVVNLTRREYRGRSSIQLKVIDMKCSFRSDKVIRENSDRAGGMDFGRIAARTAMELAAGRPVIYVYPTCRSIAKHQPAINNSFISGVVQILHGQLPWLKRDKGQQLLFSGVPQVFLLTQTLFKYLQREHKLPAHLRYIARIWPESDEPAESLYADYEVATLPTDKAALNLCGQEWKADKGGRTIIYTNRRKTVKKLKAVLETSWVEAGIMEPEARRAARRYFAACQGSTLLWDGSTSGLQPVNGIDELVLADMPYGDYELYGAYHEIAASTEIKIVTLFTQADRDFNNSYLNHLCPAAAKIKAVWEYFAGCPGNSLRQDLNILLQELEAFLHTTISWTELVSIFHILTDLDLCQIGKKGSIIEIKFIKSEFTTADLCNSLYYLEGLAEKAAFSKLERELSDELSGDGNGTRRYN